MSHDIRTVSIPKDRMRIDKFLRHAELVPTRLAASGVCAGKLVKVNGEHSVGRVQAGDVVTLARLPVDGGPVSWEPEDVVHVRVVSG